MKTLALLIIVLLALIFIGLYAFRLLDHRSDRAETDRLLSLQPGKPDRFNLDLVKDLPPPARRYFAFTIKDGTPLYTVARINMRGTFGLGTKDKPSYMNMTATQVLAAPDGFVWKMSGGAGPMRISGSDSATWTRFWLAGLLPVARAGQTPDHSLSAFGRYIAEAVFWTPAAVLPGPGVHWDAVDDTTATVTVTHGARSQTVTITVAADGRPLRVEIQRWSDANPDHVFRFQPFGGHLSDFRDFDGFRLPAHVEGGNFIGTDAYFPFFIADVTSIEFPRPAPPE